MDKWPGYRSELSNENYDAIIIGSGISGLTTAVFLAKAGLSVLVLEKHFKLGGFTHTFKRNQYEWDTGIHYIGEAQNPKSIVKKLFDYISESNLKWTPMDSNYDRIIYPDKSYDFIAPKEQFIETMCSYFPSESEGIKNYINEIRHAVKSGRSFFANKAYPPFIQKINYPFASRNFFKYANLTTKNAIAKFTSNPKLLSVLAGQWGDHGLPPGQSSFYMHSIVANHYLNGGNYPTGGSINIAKTVCTHLEKLNCKFAVNAGVDEILVENGKTKGVRLENGDVIKSKIVVSSAGVVNTFSSLLRNQSNKFQKLLSKVKPTASYVCLYLGFNKSAKDLNFKSTNFWIYPDYDHDENVAKYSNNSENEFPVLYVSFPSAKDSEWEINHPNCSTVEVLTLGHWQWYNKWKKEPWKKRGKEYEAEKEKLSQRMLKQLFKHIPQAKEHLDYYELSTPLTVRDLAKYRFGEMYGIDHTPDRFKQKWLQPRTDIKNLYLTGQDILTVGLSSALFSGLITSSAILKKNLLKEIL